MTVRRREGRALIRSSPARGLGRAGPNTGEGGSGAARETTTADESILTTITLARRDSGEADRIAVLLSREEGKVLAAARSARRPRSKLAPLVEPFTLAECRVIRGRGDYATLAGGEVVHAYRALREDVALYARASLLCEVTERGTEPGEAQPRLFALLHDALRRLNEGLEGERVELYFLLHAMHLFGYTLHFLECAACGVDLPETEALFRADAGGLLCAACAPIEAGLPLDARCRATGAAFLERRLGHALGLTVDPADLHALLRAARLHARYHLDTPLRSLSVLTSLGIEETEGR